MVLRSPAVAICCVYATVLSNRARISSPVPAMAPKVRAEIRSFLKSSTMRGLHQASGAGCGAARRRYQERIRFMAADPMMKAATPGISQPSGLMNVR